MKKRIAFLLCMLMLVSLCASCAAEEETVPEYPTAIYADAIDLGGEKLVMGVLIDYYAEGAERTLGYTQGTDFGDLATERLKDVENRYNCEIEFDYLSRPGETVYSSCMAGQYLFDFVTDESYYLVNVTRANAFVDLAALDTIDVFDESKWGSRYMIYSTMFDGGIFGVVPAALPLKLGTSLAYLVVNENRIQQQLLTDPRDYFEQGEWNWGTFGNCIETYAHNDPLTNEYVYSLASGFGGFAKDLAMSNGVDFFYLHDDGSFDLGYFSQPAIDAYNQAYEWFYGATADNVISGESWNTLKQRAIEGSAVISLVLGSGIVSNTSSLVYYIDNFGLVPFPVGPNARGQDNYKSNYSAASFTMCIPLTAKDPEVSALIIDKLYEPFKGFETEESVIDYLYKNYFADRRDAELYINMSKGDHIYYNDHRHGMSTMFDSLNSNGITKGVESYRSAHYETAEKYILPAYLTMLQYEEYFHE